MPDILCSLREAIPENLLPACGSIRASDLPGDVLAGLPCEWRPRSEVEEDPSYKQWIGYGLLRRRGQIAHYERKGNEKRLHDLHSCGIGGHIEREDERESLMDTIRHSLIRELWEETGIRIAPDRLRFLGVMNEEETAVGKVHLGALFLLELEDDECPQSTKEIPQMYWNEPGKILAGFNLERWSELALSALNK